MSKRPAQKWFFPKDAKKWSKAKEARYQKAQEKIEAEMKPMTDALRDSQIITNEMLNTRVKSGEALSLPAAKEPKWPPPKSRSWPSRR
jgi:hypothetical protein